MDVKILVLTRFSVYNYPGGMTATYLPHVKTEQDFIDHLYSKERLTNKLNSFLNLTLPSIVSQSYKPYKWLIFYSKQLPNKYKKMLTEAISKYPYIELVLTERFDNVSTEDIIAPYVPNSPYITVRIDDDDAFAPNYFSLLRKNYKPNTVYSPNNGYTVSDYNFTTQKGKAVPFKWITCAATGLAYSNGNVFALGDHSLLHKKPGVNIVYLNNTGLTIRIVNESNLSKATHSDGIAPIDFSFKQFIQGKKKLTIRTRNSKKESRKNLKHY
jgi:hypothetical protein